VCSPEGGAARRGTAISHVDLLLPWHFICRIGWTLFLTFWLWLSLAAQLFFSYFALSEAWLLFWVSLKTLFVLFLYLYKAYLYYYLIYLMMFWCSYLVTQIHLKFKFQHFETLLGSSLRLRCRGTYCFSSDYYFSLQTNVDWPHTVRPQQTVIPHAPWWTFLDYWVFVFVNEKMSL